NVKIDDTTNPDTVVLADVVAECSTTVTAPTTNDTCVGIITGSTSDPLTYTTQGDYVITWTFDDGNGNSITVNQNVKIDDTIAPVADVVSLPNIVGECTAILVPPIATDICAGVVTATTTDSTTYSVVGVYTVTWLYSDGNGNTITQTQSVEVQDTGVPAPDVTTLPTLTEECNITITTIPTASDGCGGTTITATTTDSLSYTSQGTYSITWIYTGGNGNVTTQAQTVIIKDTTAPVSPTLSDITGECSITAIAPTTTDICSGIITGTTTDSLTYTVLGTHVIAWVFDDGNGNSIVVNQNVIVSSVTTITTQPSNRATTAGTDVTFSVVAATVDTYQWQVSIDGGSTYSDITNGSAYTGAQTSTLTVVNPDIDKSGYLFRVDVSKSSNVLCGSITSDFASLAVSVGRVITNRRITHRVKKN
ncbi:MAG: hypothetical protein V3U92_01960, partial [Cellulophaga sp.]